MSGIVTQCGMFGGRRGGVEGGFGIASVSKTHNESSTTHIIPMPPGMQEGDMLLALFQQGPAGAQTYTSVPAGWVMLTTNTGLQGFWKYAAASEPVNQTWILSLGRTLAAVVLRITGAHPTDPIEEKITAGENVSISAIDSPWGIGDFIGIACLGNRGDPNLLGTVSPPSDTTIREVSFNDPTSTLNAVVVVADRMLDAVDTWTPASGFTTTGTFSVVRSYKFLIRPA